VDDELELVKKGAVSVAVLTALAYALPYVAVLAALGLAYWLYTLYRDSAGVRRRRGREQAQRLYEAACELQRNSSFPSADEFEMLVWRRVIELLNGLHPSFEVAALIFPLAHALYLEEGFGVDAPEPPTASTEIDLGRYQDALSKLVARLSNPEAVDIACETIATALAGFCRHLPPLALQSEEELLKSADAERLVTQFSVPLINTLTVPGEAVEALITPFYAPRVRKAGLFASLKEQFERNQHGASDVPYTRAEFESPKLLMPRDHAGEAEAVVWEYLKHTGFEALFRANIPFDIPDAVRFEHHWIVAGSGHGKSQTLQYLIAHDLERVAKGEGSVVVIDSQGDLIKNIAGLGLFGPGEPLAGKLCLIDPTDIEYPVALNLFDVGMERINGYSQLDRERLMNGVLELYDFVLGSLLSAELTQKQSVIFRYITRLMLHIPGATIHTFRELMEPKGYEKYKEHIEKLDGTARAFFETEFNSKQFEDTKRQVVRRLWGILENQTFERMFSHPKNKLDLFTEMNAGKVILINTAKELLKQTGTEIFGRFFIALIAQAAQERATLPKEKRMPTFVYVDECADYLDQNVSIILEQARKFNVGMILAHQYVGQLSAKLQESFAANTSIKFAGGVSDKDARQLGHMLRCTPEFIEGQGKGQFAASVRNMTSAAVSLRIPFGHLEAMPRMTDEEQKEVRGMMRERYAVYWKDVNRDVVLEDVSEASIVRPRVNPDTIDTAPASEW
tara:strand:- start:7063 stop:9270 length:2208 start_codon:yes stop_codon:yes gene_type:complete